MRAVASASAADARLEPLKDLPGFFVTGNLYTPRQIAGKAPGVLISQGHDNDARLSIFPGASVRREIAEGRERFG
ncbi:MAG: hypothetical protein ACO3NZ_13025 [Pirellulales bacterium]|jgi:hypothetical protein